MPDRVPTTWGEVVSLEYGKALRGYKDASGDVPVFGTNGRIGWHDTALCLHPGVVIGRKGAYRGVHWSDRPFFVIDTAFYLKPRTGNIDLKWAYYKLLTYDINSMDSGSAIPSTSRDAFYRLPVEVPPIDEQRAIASVLGALDDKIELNRRMNETLEAMAQLVFDNMRLAPRQLDEVDRENGWRAGIVADFVECVGGNTPSTKDPSFWSGQHAFATPKDLSGLGGPLLTSTARSLSDSGAAKVSSGVLPKGTLLMSSRAPIGYVAVTDMPVTVNQGFVAIPNRGDNERHIHFMRQWIIRHMDAITGRAGGSTFAEISKSAFRSLPMFMPPASLLDRHAETVEPLWLRLRMATHENATLTQLRDTLLPKLLSGEVRVRQAEEIMEAAT